MAFYTRKELKGLGFKSIGENVLLSQKASIYGIGNIEIGNNVRIDDFCVISAGIGGIKLGNNIHIGVFSSLIGAGRIELKDFVNISSKVAIYSSNDDYSGHYMTNPTLPSEYTNVTSSYVMLEKHVIIGSGSVVLPGVTLETGVAIGALTMVNSTCEAFGIYCGNPAKKIKERKRNLLALEKEYLTLAPHT